MLSAAPLSQTSTMPVVAFSLSLEGEEKVVLGCTFMFIFSTERLPVLGLWEPGKGNSPEVIALKAPAGLPSSKLVGFCVFWG